MFSEDNYDTLITKAALHGARLLKKPHQATAVNLASHLWWQEVPPDEESPSKESEPAVSAEDGGENVKKAVRTPPGAPRLRCLTCDVSILTRIANAF